MKTMPIEDGTIQNLRYKDHRRYKCWVAIVQSDKSKPGGLDRNFLRRAPSGRVFVDGIRDGMWLEFAGDYFTHSGNRIDAREYYKVVDITENNITLEPVEKDEIGKIRPQDE